MMKMKILFAPLSWPLFALLCWLGSTATAQTGHKIDYLEAKLVTVAALTTNSSGGTVIPNGQKVGIARVDITGSDPTVYAMVVWDYGGGAEKILVSTVQRADLLFDVSDTFYQVTGDGTKSLKIILVNDTANASPVIGGTVEIVKL